MKAIICEILLLRKVVSAMFPDECKVLTPDAQTQLQELFSPLQHDKRVEWVARFILGWSVSRLGIFTAAISAH